MPLNFSPSSSAVNVQPSQLIQAAGFEAGIFAAGDVLSAEDAAWGLEKLQRLIDFFNAQREMIFSVSFSQFTLTPNHAPHTIGPGGDFNVPIRPVQINSAAFILSSTSVSPVDQPINIRDKDWWARLPVKSQTSSICTDLYYDPSLGVGTLNFWPICTAANPVRLELWNSLAQAIDLVTPLGFVQGYWDAIVLSLALRLCPSYEKQPSPLLVEQQREAMQAIFGNNNEPPHIELDCGGIPSSSRGGRPDFNFLTGLRE